MTKLTELMAQRIGNIRTNYITNFATAIPLQ
jgi:hypothetical protein